MFEFNPELVRADDFDAEEEELVIEREKEEGEDEVRAQQVAVQHMMMWSVC